MLNAIKVNISDTSSVWNYSHGYNLFLCDASGGAFTVSLPDAENADGTLFTFKKTDTSGNAVTITAAVASQNIDGAETYTLAATNDSATIVATNGGYYVVAEVK